MEDELKTYVFIRSVPLLVGVRAEDEGKAWVAAGRRVDDFMTDAMESVPRWNHELESGDEYTEDFLLEYHGDAVYLSKIEDIVRNYENKVD